MKMVRLLKNKPNSINFMFLSRNRSLAVFSLIAPASLRTGRSYKKRRMNSVARAIYIVMATERYCEEVVHWGGQGLTHPSGRLYPPT